MSYFTIYCQSTGYSLSLYSITKLTVFVTFFFLNLSCQATNDKNSDECTLMCQASVIYSMHNLWGVFFAIQVKQSYRTGKDIAPATAECEQTQLTQDRMQPSNTQRLCELEAPRPRTPRTPRTPT